MGGCRLWVHGENLDYWTITIQPDTRKPNIPLSRRHQENTESASMNLEALGKYKIAQRKGAAMEAL